MRYSVILVPDDAGAISVSVPALPGCVSVGRPLSYDANRIREIRRTFDVSQREFAKMLNVSLATVRAWEQGARTPDGAATRLLAIAERRPDIILESASSADRNPEQLMRTG